MIIFPFMAIIADFLVIRQPTMGLRHEMGISLFGSFFDLNFVVLYTTMEVHIMDALELVERRLAIINELAGLEEMRRGSVVEQYQERTLPTGEKVLRGPYPLYSYKEKGRTISRRLKSEKEVLRYREQIQNFRRFEELTRELLLIGEQLCELGSDQEKKQRNSPSKGAKK
ncbi:MAG: DUF6788 family protein [Pseudomonadota bacterium]